MPVANLRSSPNSIDGDVNSAMPARLASRPRSANARTLTVDTTVRVITLGQGGWRLYGSPTAVFYATRNANADGTLASGEQLAIPLTTDLVASTAGTPAAGKAYGNGFAGTSTEAEAGGSAVGAMPLPTDTTDWREITVAPGAFLNLYVRVAASTASPTLIGPFE